MYLVTFQLNFPSKSVNLKTRSHTCSVDVRANRLHVFIRKSSFIYKAGFIRRGGFEVLFREVKATKHKVKTTLGLKVKLLRLVVLTRRSDVSHINNMFQDVQTKQGAANSDLKETNSTVSVCLTSS